MGSDDRSVSILFTGDTEIRRLNRDYRGKDKPTDVLSFPSMSIPASGRKSAANPFDSCLGDLVISVQTARRQAKQYGQTLRQELHRLITHGYLHLLGYDHERVDRKKADAMRRIERRLLLRFEGDYNVKGAKEREEKK